VISSRGRCLALVLLLLGGTPAHAQVNTILEGLGAGQTGSLSDARIGAGLKEALEVATEKSVASTGRVDGFFANQAIKILMPDKLKPVESGLRAIGYGPNVDEFVLSMNRAAERAAPAARPIFLDAIKTMTFDDARRILTGGSTAATDFFKTKTTDQLRTAFRPAVDQAMGEVGVARQYNELVGRFQAIPFARAEAFDVDGYVVGKALDGLFHVVGEQERLIRTNPAARTTELLKEVFTKR
jgi:Protein of unknown function (DUF4197)